VLRLNSRPGGGDDPEIRPQPRVGISAERPDEPLEIDWPPAGVIVVLKRIVTTEVQGQRKGNMQISTINSSWQYKYWLFPYTKLSGILKSPCRLPKTTHAFSSEGEGVIVCV
jgi:hypothetical protein